MILALIVHATLQGAPSFATQKPSQVIGAMFKRYFEANVLQGSITYSASDGTATITVRSDLAIERPSKVYLRQTKDGPHPGQVFVTSNGRLFSYPAPDNKRDGQQLMEGVTQHGVQMSAGEIVEMGRQSLLDSAAPLDIILAEAKLLKYVKWQWASLKDLPATKEGWRTIGGDWQENPGQGVSATYSMTIDPDYNLRQYSITQNVGLPSGQIVTVRNNWDIDVQLNGKLDPSLFTVRK